jgi:V/A-type H+-transporting ATPase subunit C
VTVARYAYLNARVSVFAERLLGPDEIQALVDGHLARPDAIPPELAADAVGTDLTDDLDQRHTAVLLRELAVLIRPLSGTARDLLSYWAHRFELTNLKVIIRGKMTAQPQAAIQQDLLEMGSLERLPTAELLQTDSLEELLRRLDQTTYASITEQARQMLERGEAMFALDAAIDRRYFAGLARRGNEAGSAGGQLLRAIVGSVIDRVNLVWLLRYRFAYNFPPAQAYYLLIPAGHRLSGAQLQQLAQRASFEEVIATLPGPFARLLAGTRNSTEATLRLEFETWRIASDVLYHTAFNVARALAYMVLRERDLRRWRAIVRGRNLHGAPEMIRSALGLPPPEGGQSHA